MFLPSVCGAQQSKSTLSGRVYDNADSPVAYASVAVYNGEKTVTGTVTDNDGKFSLKVVQGNDKLDAFWDWADNALFNQIWDTLIDRLLADHNSDEPQIECDNIEKITYENNLLTFTGIILDR